MVAAEVAITAAAGRRSAIEAHAALGGYRARLASTSLRELAFMLTGAQFGITLASLGLGFVAEPAIADLIIAGVGDHIDLPEIVVHGVAAAIALTLVVFLHMVLGEMAPKNIAIAEPIRTMLWGLGAVPGLRQCHSTRALGPQRHGQSRGARVRRNPARGASGAIHRLADRGDADGAAAHRGHRRVGLSAGPGRHWARDAESPRHHAAANVGGCHPRHRDPSRGRGRGQRNRALADPGARQPPGRLPGLHPRQGFAGANRRAVCVATARPT